MGDVQGDIAKDMRARGLNPYGSNATASTVSVTTPERYDWAEDPTAQDVIDAMRIAVMAQNDPVKAMGVVKCLIEFAPETDSNRGIDLLLRLIAEATLKVEMVDHE